MTQAERRRFLIQYLLKELPRDSQVEIPANSQRKKRLLRSLFNIRMPAPAARSSSKSRTRICRRNSGKRGSPLCPASGGASRALSLAGGHHYPGL